MSQFYSDNDKDSSGFCKLAADLVISYNGSFQDCSPQARSSLVGTVLTRSGQLLSRANRRASWEPLNTPSVYLFYDNDSYITYLVDTCKCSIKPIDPCGRILDCTDRVIYEIKCGEWSPICDLSNQEHRTIVLCNTVPFGATTITFTFPGCNPCVDPFSEIPAERVVFSNGIATVSFTPTDLPVGGCAVLLFTVCIDNKQITVAKIFIRAPADLTPTPAPRFSAINGVTGSVVTGTGIVAPGLPPVLPSPGTVFITGWTELYDRPAPGSFNPATGVYTITTPGDYNFEAEFSYDFGTPVPNAFATAVTVPVVSAVPTSVIIDAAVTRTRVPYFALVRNNVVVAVAPVFANRRLVTPEDFAATITGIPPGTPIILNPVTGVAALQTLDIIEVGNVKISIALTANTGDTFRVIYVEDSAFTAPAAPLSAVTALAPGTFTPVITPIFGPFAQVPALLTFGTTFHGEFLGPATPTGVALPFTTVTPVISPGVLFPSGGLFPPII